MIIKKLEPVHGGTFPGAAYNENKVKEGVAELVGHANIDGNFLHTLHTLHGVGIDCCNEVEQYMQSRSQTFGNTRSTQFQLHLALSCKGQEKNKEQLVAIAHAMMKEYGAARQPYLIYFHHDTENNHVHILTTRVTSKGRLLPDHHDYARLNTSLNKVITEDMRNDMDRMFDYSFNTEGQLMNIARGLNYKVGDSKENPELLMFYHGGTEAFTVSRSDVAERIAEVKNDRRDALRREEVAKRTKAIIIKYREMSLNQMPPTSSKAVKAEGKTERAKTKKDLVEKKKKSKIHPEIKKLTNAEGKPLSKTEQYHMNWLIETLRSRFGIAVHFQKDKNGVVRGYGVVDHNNKVALNGSDVMKLADIVNFKQWQEAQQRKSEKANKPKAKVGNVKKADMTDKPKDQRPWNTRSQNTATRQTADAGNRETELPRIAQSEQKPRPSWQSAFNRNTNYSTWGNKSAEKAVETVTEKVNPQSQPKAQQNPQSQQSTQPKAQQQKQPKPKARIYQPDSTLDIYRPLFKVGLMKSGGKKLIRMQMDGKIYEHAITDNQRLWLVSAPAEAREDIAIRLAVFYFYKEIYDSYRRQLRQEYIKRESAGMDIPEGNLRAYKQRNGLWCVALDYKGSTMKYVLSIEESRLMNRADANGSRSELDVLTERFFKEKVAQHEANDIASHASSCKDSPMFSPSVPAMVSIVSMKSAEGATDGMR